MRVNTEELASQASELRLLAIRIADIQETILHVNAVLSRESIGERFRPALNRTALEMELCGDDLRRLSMALHQISDAYALAERRVVEETEYASTHLAWMEPQMIRLPSIRMFAGADTAVGTGESGAEITGAIDWTPWDPDAAT